MTYKKDNGIYYTPKKLADFLVKEILSNYSESQSISILEPSAGDGVFVSSFYDNNFKKNILNFDIVEKRPTELKKIENKLKNKNGEFNFFAEDYLQFQIKSNKIYDVVIGNPPYIPTKKLTKKQLELCFNIHQEFNLSSKTIKNLWVAFLVSGISKLHNAGILCFVLPSEILQVSYAEDLRTLLKKEFDLIQIYTFKDLIFEGIEQDAVVILAKKKSSNKGIQFFESENLESLSKNEFITKNIVLKNGFPKWSNYYLTEDELNLLTKVTSKFKLIQDYCESQVGIVTGANKYFIQNREGINKFKLNNYSISILQKGSFFGKGCIFRKKDFDFIEEQNKPCFMLFPKENDVIFKINCSKYISFGESEEINGRYKCKIRDPWYIVPSVWKSPLYFFKRTHKIPKLILNEANVYATDGAYRVTPKKEYTSEGVLFSFFNTLTLIYAELQGRFYGGGVLELIPSEFKKLPLPYVNKSYNDIIELDDMMRNGDIEKAIKDNDIQILNKKYGISKKDIKSLQDIKYKLTSRRLKTN